MERFRYSVAKVGIVWGRTSRQASTDSQYHHPSVNLTTGSLEAQGMHLVGEWITVIICRMMEKEVRIWKQPIEYL
jgi:hypothetical protein